MRGLVAVLALLLSPRQQCGAVCATPVQPVQPGQLVIPRVELLGWGIGGWRHLPPTAGLPLGSRPQAWRARARAMHEWLWSDSALTLGVRRETVKYQGRWFNGTGFGISDYMGDGRYGSGPGSALTVIGTMLSAALLDLPLPKHEFVMSARGYVCSNGVTMDNPCQGVPSVGTFWYTLVNQCFFVGLTAKVPELDPDLEILYTAADSWHAATKVMAANASGFDQTGFDFNTMLPIRNGLWTEPDSAGGIAYVSLLAYHHTADPKHLETVRLALDFLETRTASPLYEMMLPFGAYAAARLNAMNKTGKQYDVAKLVSWTLVDGKRNPTRGGYGMIVGHWGGWYPADPYLTACTKIQVAARAATIQAANEACDAMGAKACGGFLWQQMVVDGHKRQYAEYCAPGSLTHKTGVSSCTSVQRQPGGSREPPCNSTIGYTRVGYTARPILTACDLLPASSQAVTDASPSTVADAEAHCDAIEPPGTCGGFLYQASNDAGTPPVVTMCKPGTFQSGVPNKTSPIGYPRGGLDASGLIGGMGGGNHDSGPEGDYAFFGDGAWFAYALAPVARYQPSLARALAKWLLSLELNSRLYWPGSLPDDKQCNPDDPRDPNGTLPYEAVRHCVYFRPEQRCLSGAGAGPIGTGDVCELLNCTDDPWKLGVNGTDRGLYGGVYAGVLGAIVVPTSEPNVPAFDLMATDPWAAVDPPVAALCVYNPLTKPLNITLTASAPNISTGVVYDVVNTASTARESWGPATQTAGGLQVTGIVPSDHAVVLEFQQPRARQD
eukprot:COSAG02_NODE_2973_length_7635_cov_7.444400_4_plen_780_part_00